MATYRITGPDGSVYEVTAPEGATEEQVMSYFQSQLQQPEQMAQPSQPATSEPAKPASFSDRLMQAARPEMGIFRGMRDPIDAGAQMLVRGAAATGLVPQSEVDRVDGINREAEQQYQQSRQGQEGFDGLRVLGQIGATAPVFPNIGGGLAARTLAGSASGAAFGTLQPVREEGNFWGQKAEQAQAGAIGGAIAAPLSSALSRIIRPKTPANVRAMMDEGVPLTPGQILGGGWRAAEEKVKSIPILGASIRNAEQRGLDSFNRAAINRALMPLGKTLPKGMAGHEAIEFAETALGQSYDDIITRLGARPVDNKMLSEFANLRGIVANQPKEFASRLDRIIDNEILSRTENGRLTGEAIKKAESNLGQLARGLRQNADFDTRTLGEAVEETQRILRSWMERVAPPELTSRLKSTNAGWANFKRVQRAAAATGAEGGEFTAAQLHQAVKALDRSKDKSAFAKGKALMQDLSRPAKDVLSNKVPNSGTADRLLGSAAVLGPLAGASVSPALALGAIPAAAYTRPGQAALSMLLARRPPGFEALAEGVGAVGTPLLTGGLYGLLAP